MNFKKLFSITVLLVLSTPIAMANNFYTVPEAATNHIKAIAPVFDFKNNSCLPSAAISASGQINGGANIAGGVTQNCRRNPFMSYSNTYHRVLCKAVPLNSGSGWAHVIRMCAHVYVLYFKKDQVVNHQTYLTACQKPLSISSTKCRHARAVNNGHRHDIVRAVIYTRNNRVTHASILDYTNVPMANGVSVTKPWSQMQSQNGHAKFVHFQDPRDGTHRLRFANANDTADNPTGSFVTPTILSWSMMTGNNGVTNAQMRQNLSTFQRMPLKNINIESAANSGKPGYYPTFTR